MVNPFSCPTKCLIVKTFTRPVIFQPFLKNMSPFAFLMSGSSCTCFKVRHLGKWLSDVIRSFRTYFWMTKVKHWRNAANPVEELPGAVAVTCLQSHWPHLTMWIFLYFTGGTTLYTCGRCEPRYTDGRWTSLHRWMMFRIWGGVTEDWFVVLAQIGICGIGSGVGSWC